MAGKKALTSRERYARMFAHREADRVPIADHPWGATIERWEKEGLPKGVHYADYFDIDFAPLFSVDTSPRFEEKVVEETDQYVVRTTGWGVTIRNWKHDASTPEFLDHTIVDRAAWKKARKRMTPARDRVNWDRLKSDYALWRKKGWWTQCLLWYGFDVTHSWAVGTERMLMALAEDPEWCVDMFNHYLDLNIAMLEMVIDAGYAFDSTYCYDDLGFKNSQFMSMGMFRELLKPVHKRAIEWAHSKGMKAHLHSCGDVMPFVPEFVEIGLDCLNPLEIKAGMDPIALKRDFGDRLVFNGGLNAAIWGEREKFEAEMRRLVPVMKQGGGYICGSDHSVPSSVSLEDFRRFVELAKELGRY
jgi:uroporphyrinogen decarboxylase